MQPTATIETVKASLGALGFGVLGFASFGFFWGVGVLVFWSFFEFFGVLGFWDVGFRGCVGSRDSR